NRRASFYPTLTATMSMGYAGYYDEFAPGKQLNNDWISNRYVGMSLKIPVFDGFQRNFSVKQKQVAVRRHVNTLSMMRSMAGKELEDARTSYASNLAQAESSKRSLDLAEQLFASAQTEFESGLTTMTDLLNAQNDLSGARTNYTTALLNLKLAELAWKKASGTLALEN
ncbi:MAG: TolC family protein, partial [Bacteroidia bacterium]|nr:TolC family protein [Bacteroidia bacterium]